jgi:hypothetical protein
LKILKQFFSRVWHRKKHALSARFSKSSMEYSLDFLALISWFYLLISSKTPSLAIIVCALVMLAARAFPVIKAFWKGDKNKLNFLKKRRIESNTCLMEINRCLVDIDYATPEKIKEIRQKLLRCIVDTIRAYRNDLQGSKIFSNLLILDHDDLVVAIRNAPDRADGTRYPKGNLQCSKVLETKKPLHCGDVKYIDNSREMRYKSFMAIPVLNYNKDHCLAIVTIDSTELHHFDEIYETFDTLLSPYITTLTTTFIIADKVGLSGGKNE